MKTSRIRSSSLAIAVVALLSAGIASLITGVLANRAADTKTSRDQQINASVTTGEIREVVVGSAELNTTGSVGVPAVAGPGEKPVVTYLASTVRPVREGDVVAMVGSRPTIALVGKLPMFRSLSLGMNGRDVQQLNSALARLGLPSTLGATFTSATQQGLHRLFARSVGGFRPRACRECIVFVSHLPGHFLTSMRYGKTAKGQVGVIVPGRGASVIGAVPPIDADSVAEGMLVSVRTVAGDVITGKVSEALNREQGRFRIALRGRLTPGISASLRASPGTLEVVVRRSPPDSLVVPVTALLEASDGVTRVKNGHSGVECEVEVIAISLGQAAVELPDCDIRVGDLVAVSQ